MTEILFTIAKVIGIGAMMLLAQFIVFLLYAEFSERKTK